MLIGKVQAIMRYVRTRRQSLPGNLCANSRMWHVVCMLANYSRAQSHMMLVVPLHRNCLHGDRESSPFDITNQP
jgi:hypothetical protein